MVEQMAETTKMLTEVSPVLMQLSLCHFGYVTRMSCLVWS